MVKKKKNIIKIKTHRFHSRKRKHGENGKKTREKKESGEKVDQLISFRSFFF